MVTAADADAWWHAQPPERRLTIYGWLNRGTHLAPTPTAGQLEMFPTDPEETA
ncbi:hypothetical protein M1M07_07525 [Rhodococcus sp. HM1]|uniref:hypothetical protein n=1 Tax=Rhodococcus sp. HM1 TaxID=2937759 RepID=UPI00200B3AA6|nr:hypothetical protein [Rhodococcus sp. HM1]MCK8670966.1 hypothetical protein [Rhodococcus sp. HM1]